ncbi:UNVERIFIED_ORG: type IV secretory pathway VirB10-like protein [Rhizobium etli]
MAEEEITQIPGERAETSAGGRLDNNPILKRGAVALAIVVFVAFALWSMRGQDKPSDGAEQQRVVIRQTSDFDGTGRKTIDCINWRQYAHILTAW